ncbi:MAG TPA: DUF481 domain-containing protein, partial [Candidatus Dormibacteraeota bacterium]|nr:DUF481 domain-containing protein [Candidatus Dormibacteraeota bacterium]
MRLSGFLVLLAAMIIATPAMASADTVVLQNGDHVTGTFVSADGKTMAIKTPYEGQITLKWADVKDF